MPITKLRAGLQLVVVLLVVAPATIVAGTLGTLPSSCAGVLPCADCAEIRHHVDFFPMGACVVAFTYSKAACGETFYLLGTWDMPADSASVLITTSSGTELDFALYAPGVPRKLDMAGTPVDSRVPRDLVRAAGCSPHEPRLTMRGTCTYIADAGVFTECATGLRWPVAPGARDHERAWSSSRSDAAAGATPQPLLVKLQGRVPARPRAAPEGDRATLLVEHFEGASPLESCGVRGAATVLSGPRWVVTSVRGIPVVQGTGERDSFLPFDENATRITGFTGCHRMSGTLRTGHDGRGQPHQGGPPPPRAWSAWAGRHASTGCLPRCATRAAIASPTSIWSCSVGAAKWRCAARPWRPSSRRSCLRSGARGG
jgi:copper homeostasis protein (lipoprotein)